MYCLHQVPPEPELGHRNKMSQSHGGGSDSKPESSHLRHATSTDLSHISRIQGDTVSPSYQSPMTSPMGLTHKSDLSLQKGPPTFLPTTLPTVPTPSSLQPRPEAKLEHSGHRSIDMVQLLTVGRLIDRHCHYILNAGLNQNSNQFSHFFFCVCTEVSYCLARSVGTEERPGCCPAALCFWQHHTGPALPATPRGRSSSAYCPEDEA